MDWKKYAITFVITAAIFGTAFFISDTISDRRVAQIENIQEQISIDILSLETQFELLGELSCEDIDEDTILSEELNSLARRLGFTEGQLGTDNPEVLRLKRHYTLLQIKDYLLMKEVAAKCDIEPVFVLYFYSNEGDCKNCERAGHVLSDLREDFPSLRIYSFDYNLDLSALRTLITIHEVENRPPAVVIDGEVHYNFRTRAEIEEIFPVLQELREQQEEEQATTTGQAA